MTEQYEYVVVGSGAGGATLARELALRGREVLVLERGTLEESVGTFRDALRYFDASRFLRQPRTSTEGVVLWRTLMAGGSTVVSAGNGVRALEGELAALGVDLDAEFAAAEREMGVEPLDEALLSSGSRRLREAARSLGYRLEPMPKFVDQAQCLRCARCTLGCRAGAKWTALDELAVAEEHGTTVRFGVTVESVVVEDGVARGVRGVGPAGPVEVRAEVVVLAAGALATPVVLQRSGLDAGNRLGVDTFVNVYGVVDEPGVTQLGEPQMALVAREFHESEGFVLSPYLNVPREVRLLEGGLACARLPVGRTLGLMVKIADEDVGSVDANGTVSKPVTERDRARLDAGVALARETLVAAGADPERVVVSKPQGAHPAATAAIGDVVDADLATSVEGLYVCDASVLPAPPGLPPILTIVALARRLATHLTGTPASTVAGAAVGEA
jgi:choline dehydrogenase-like flavoprotein